MINTTTKSILLYFFFFILSVIFLYFFSFSTSPLFKNLYGFDSAIFMVIGKTLDSGKLLYTDIFDHKGPVLFFFQYIGWSMGKVGGIFILQSLNLAGVMYLIYKMINLIDVSSKYVGALVLSLLSLLCFTNIEGNQSEEYSLLFIFIPSLFILKYILRSCTTIKHPPLYSFVYGICFALVAFNRITNAASISAIICGVALFLLIKSEYKNCFSNILAFAGGVIVATCIISIPFLYNGRLYDMLYATFLFNFKYSNSINNISLFDRLFSINHHNVFSTILKVTPNILFLIILIIRYTKIRYQKELFCLILIPVFTYISINLGLKTEHYLTINAVPLILSLVLYLDAIKKNIIAKKSILNIILVIYITLMIIYFMYQGRSVYKIYNKLHTDIETLKQSDIYYVDIDLVNSLIKKDERNSVFGYNLPPEWYLKVDMIPPFKYFTNQENWIKSDSTIYYQINKYITDTPPNWIVIPEKRIVPWVVGVEDNPILKEKLETQYTLEGQDINNKYYKKRIDNTCKQY